MKEIYVGNLAYTVNEAELRSFFEGFGDIKNVKLITDRETGQSKGFAFVEFATQADAEKAVKDANGQALKGRNIKVNLSRQKTGGTGGGSGSSRGGGGGSRSRW